MLTNNQPTDPTHNAQPQKTIVRVLFINMYSKIMLVSEIYYIYLHVKSGIVCLQAELLQICGF